MRKIIAGHGRARNLLLKKTRKTNLIKGIQIAINRYPVRVLRRTVKPVFGNGIHFLQFGMEIVCNIGIYWYLQMCFAYVDAAPFVIVTIYNTPTTTAWLSNVFESPRWTVR